MPIVRRLRYTAAKSPLRVPLAWYRHRGIQPSDVFVASYPRSGSTWLRFLLFEALTHKEAGFDDVNRIIPDVGMQQGASRLLPGGGRLIKTHEAYRPEYNRAIYLVRDVRDVVLSEHAYQKAHGWIDCDLNEYIRVFLEGTVNGYGAWQDHARGWIDSPLATRGDLLLVRYKELRKDTLPQLQRIMQFLGVKVDAESLANAIRNNNVQRMRAKEEKTPQIDARKMGDEEKRFVRKGAVGGWRETLTPNQVARLERATGEVLSRLGYQCEADAFQSVPQVASAD